MNRKQLEQLYHRLNRRKYVHPDPLEFLCRYDAPADRELVACFCGGISPPADPVRYDFALTRLSIRDDMNMADITKSQETGCGRNFDVCKTPPRQSSPYLRIQKQPCSACKRRELRRAIPHCEKRQSRFPRRRLEAAGIEPASRDVLTPVSTCVVGYLFLAGTDSNRHDSVPASPTNVPTE